MIGIYKITAPNNKIYIGQSINIKIRFDTYKRLDCIKQPKLYNSFIKYGVDNFKFEIIFTIKEINKDLLNKLESAFIEFYDSVNTGLNCTTGGDSFKCSEETKQKMSNSAKGKSKSEEHRLNISKSKLGIPLSEEHKLKLSNSKKDKPLSEKQLINLKQMQLSGTSSKKIKQYDLNGILISEFNSITEASNITNIGRTSINNCLKKLSKTAGKYKWEYSIN